MVRIFVWRILYGAPLFFSASCLLFYFAAFDVWVLLVLLFFCAAALFSFADAFMTFVLLLLAFLLLLYCCIVFRYGG